MSESIFSISAQGDSGCPAVHKEDGAFTLVGIVSFGFECDVHPGYYTRVSAYAPWIAEKIDELRRN
ncbi:hypothetical protein HPB48_009234 [Haemaphysalis longicornis]|uniref:Peptidase S1 domain-containing protein n=1 Tax=Haemaphysalis longicornis TaxID=44386 RepID=A0A9J6FVY1_HAELO|nr:hypothetical protein HPB48_009234 [Haemaphysalis longicornis]